jgi:hypothetical protein
VRFSALMLSDELIFVKNTFWHNLKCFKTNVESDENEKCSFCTGR